MHRLWCDSDSDVLKETYTFYCPESLSDMIHGVKTLTLHSEPLIQMDYATDNDVAESSAYEIMELGRLVEEIWTLEVAA